MKKLLSLILAVITVLILTIGVSAKTVLKGDINLDGKITAADARATLRISAKLDKADDTQMIIADVTGDKKITASDARKILRAAAKLEGALGEIEIGSNEQTETTTVAQKETTTKPVVKTEVNNVINKDLEKYIDEFDNMKKVESTDSATTYSNGKIAITADPSMLSDNKISSITVYDSSYMLNGISVDMTPAKATDTLKKAEWIVSTQNSDEISLSKNLMKIIINVSDSKITSIEYLFAESMLSPSETTTVPVTETTTTADAESTTVSDTETTTSSDSEHTHSYTEAVLAPTCTEKGFTTFTCILCGDSYTADETEPTGHDYVTVTVNPTCTQDGYTGQTCSVCDDTVISDTVPATGHNAAWVSVIVPAPGVEGLDQYKCRTCSEVLSEETRPALPLPETTTEEPTTEEPTTEEPTTEEPTTEEPTTEEPTTEEPTTEEPTTEEPTTEEPTTEEPTTEEPTTEEPTTEEPTTEEPTTEEPTTEEPTTEHIHNLTFTIVPVSCTENGYTRFECIECDYVFESDSVPATGHNASWVTVTPADIGVEGLEQNKCKICNEVLEERIIPALEEGEIETPEGEITVDELPTQIKAFMNGHFGIEGYNYSGKEKSSISMYISPNHAKAGMDFSGMKIDMLIKDIQKKNPSVYLLRPDVKKYAKLTSIDMAALGMTIDDLKFDFGGGISSPESIILSTQTISGVRYNIYTIYSGTEYCKIYMDGEEIKRIETYTTETKMLKSRIDVTTFTANPSDSVFSVSGYKNALSYLFLFT